MNWLMLLVSTLILAMLIFALVMRYFIHLERMALIKRGIIPPTLVNPILKRGSFGLLLAGLITTLSGGGLLAGLYYGLGRGFWLIGGFVPIGVGSALVLGYFMSGGQDEPTDAKREESSAADGQPEFAPDGLEPQD